MLKTMLAIIEWTLFGIIACLCGLLLLSNYSHNFPLKVYTVLTGSMQPAIPVGSLVMAIPVDTKNLRIGSIITFSSPDEPQKLIVHRIHAIEREGDSKAYITKGDNNNAVDNWRIFDPQIKGTAIAYLPYLGFLSGSAKTPLGFIAIVGTPALFMMLIYIRHIIIGIREYADAKAKKAVGEYIRSQRKAQTLHKMLGAYALVVFIPCASVYAAFTTQVTAENVTFATAESFTSPTITPSATINPTSSPTTIPTSSPTPIATPTITPSSSPCTSNCNTTIILNQSGSSTTINVNATTQGGSTNVTINSNQSNTQQQNMSIVE